MLTDQLYKEVYQFNDMPRAENLCNEIITYLLDLPRNGYMPSDVGARADLARMLWYDTADALDRSSHSLPTAEEKRSMIYNALVPTPTEEQAPHGYRLFMQPRIGETQTEQKTELRIFMGETYPVSDYRAKQAIEFQILCGMSLDTMAGGISRSYYMQLCLIRALNGVDIGGGSNTIHFNREFYHFSGSEYFNDGRFNVGYYLRMATEFNTSGEDTIR